ncbi:hypothetical protein AVEN_80075-1, partial [Araneus ventricosus]
PETPSMHGLLRAVPRHRRRTALRARSSCVEQVKIGARSGLYSGLPNRFHPKPSKSARDRMISRR